MPMNTSSNSKLLHTALSISVGRMMAQIQCESAKQRPAMGSRDLKSQNNHDESIQEPQERNKPNLGRSTNLTERRPKLYHHWICINRWDNSNGACHISINHGYFRILKLDLVLIYRFTYNNGKGMREQTRNCKHDMPIYPDSRNQPALEPRHLQSERLASPRSAISRCSTLDSAPRTTR